MTTPTHDELLKLAKEAGIETYEEGQSCYDADHVRVDILERFAALLCAHQAQAEPVVRPFTCWSNDDGDSWFDRPADMEFVYGLKVGDTYNLFAGWNCERATYRVTKAPDENDDDYEVECVSHSAENTAPPSSDQTWNGAIEAAAAEMKRRGQNQATTQEAKIVYLNAERAIAKLARPSQAQEPDYEAMEKEHLGDPDKKTGIYHPDNQVPSKPASCASERQAFEEWVGGANVTRTQFGDYENTFVDGQWQAWQTRSALSRAQQAPVSEQATQEKSC